MIVAVFACAFLSGLWAWVVVTEFGSQGAEWTGADSDD